MKQTPIIATTPRHQCQYQFCTHRIDPQTFRYEHFSSPPVLREQAGSTRPCNSARGTYKFLNALCSFLVCLSVCPSTNKNLKNISSTTVWTAKQTSNIFPLPPCGQLKQTSKICPLPPCGQLKKLQKCLMGSRVDGALRWGIGIIFAIPRAVST